MQWEIFLMYVEFLKNVLTVLDKFQGTQHLPTLNHKQIQNLNRPVTNKEIEPVIKNQTE